MSPSRPPSTARPDWPPGYEPGLGAPPPPPSLLKQAENFAHDLAVHAAAGFPGASPHTYEGRISACRRCDRFLAASGRCGVCGCATVALKAHWADARCPLGRWPGEGSGEPAAAAVLAPPGLEGLKDADQQPNREEQAERQE